MHKFTRNNALAIGAVALIMGAIGPWISVLGFISGGPTNSVEVSVVVFGGITILILSALTGLYMRAVSIAVGIGVLFEAIHTLVVVFQANDDGELGRLVSPGWGLYLTILAGTYVLASTWIARKSI